MSAVYFQEGEEAFENDIDKDDCPYYSDSAEAPYWCAGWDAAEFANSELLRGQAEDQRLDDPRRA
jgi:hypothetical protein